MKKLKLIYVSIEKMDKKQGEAVEKFRRVCFGNVPPKEIKEHSVAKNFGRVFVYLDDTIIGGASLFETSVNYCKIKIHLGGMGGVCVLPELRHKGIGSKIVRYALKILKEKDYDVAIHSVDLKDKIYGLYEKLGFKFLKQKVTFTDIHGNKIELDGVMLAPLKFKDIYENIINNDKTFHWGKGYW